MRIRFLKDHGFNFVGSEIETTDQAANYLIRVGVAEEITDSKEYVEKLEVKAPKGTYKEKRENKKGNVPTAVSTKSVKKAK